MSDNYHDRELPECWDRPSPETQSCLFSDPTDQVLAELRVSRDEVKRWRERRWVSFDIDAMETLDWISSGEIQFVRDVARSGLLDAQINALFSSLPSPYRYSPGTLAYSFAYGWVVPSKDSPFEVIDRKISYWLEHLAEKHDVDRLESLSRSIARQLERIRAEIEEDVDDVEELTDLNVELAEVLVDNATTELVLDGVTAINPEVAQALAEFGGRISLNGLTSVDAELADEFAKFKATSLCLDGVASLSTEAAAALANFNGDHLSLIGLREFAPYALSAFRRHLRLGISIVPLDLTEALSTFKARGLYLDAVTDLNVELAQVLSARNRDVLSLNGVSEITDQVALALTKFKGDQLSLCGLASMEVSVAEALAAFRGKWLLLNGITTLSEDAAQRLSICKASKQLNGIERIHGEMASIFSKDKGPCLYIQGVSQLDANDANHISEYEGSVLALSGLTDLDVDVATALAKFRGDSLHLDGLTGMDVDVAAALASYGGRWLLLDSIVDIDLNVARILATFQVERLSLGSEVVEILQRLPDLILVAATSGSQCIVRILLDAKVNSELRDEAGDTALHIAARKGHSTIVRLLLEHNASRTSVNAAGETPYSCAVKSGDAATIELLADEA